MAWSTSPERSWSSAAAFGRVVLAPVLGEREYRMPAGQGAEHSPGLDLGQLFRVTDEHDLRPSGARVLEERREGPRADHAGLVDDQHRARVETLAVAGGCRG